MRNPKQEGSNLYDCRVQTGKCPNGCNQCFYNRPDAYYEDIEKEHYPHRRLEIDKDSIVRMNCGHDSNCQRELVIAQARTYKNVFFNTSIPKFDFPGPVVWTANPKEEESILHVPLPDNLMFVRLRVSATNLMPIEHWLRYHKQTPVVLTFMAYYDGNPPDKENYTWKKRHINSYWCPTPDFMRKTLAAMKVIGGRLVTMCGTLDSPWCRDCRNCETYYWQTIKHMNNTQATMGKEDT